MGKSNPWTFVIRTLIVLSVILQAFNAFGSGAAWHQGCYNESHIIPDVLERFNSSEETFIAHCHDYCRKHSSSHIAVRDRRDCGCLVGIDVAYKLPSNLCNNRCNALPCGDSKTWSVYSTDHFRVENITAQTDDVLVVNVPTTISYTITLAGDINIQSGIDGVDCGLLELSWSINETAISEYSDTINVSNRTISKGILHRFESEDTYKISIKIKTCMREVSSSIMRTVVIQKPSNAEIVVSSAYNRPSCIPSSYSNSSSHPLPKSYISVFVDTPIEFEVSVSRGSFLTFNWFFSDDIIHDITQRPHVNSTCLDRSCLSSKLWHTFNNIGVFTVKVNISNVKGSIETSSTIVVLDQTVSNITFSLKDPQSNIVSLLKPVDFVVSLVTSARLVTTLEVDFGDRSKRNFSFIESPKNSSALTDLDNKMFLLADYTDDSCLLVVELDHLFANQGVFSPSIRFINRVTNTTVVTEHNVTVLNELQDARIISDRVVEVNKIVNFTANIDTSPLMTYTWVIIDSFMTIMRNVSSESSKLTHVFNNPGLYTVKVTISNPMSTDTDSMQVDVQESISGLTIQSLSSMYAATDSEASVAASALQGTNIEFIWDFGDDENHDISDSRTARTSQANYTYIDPGQYYVTVTATNGLGSVKASLAMPYVIQDPIEEILLYAKTSAVVGELVQFHAGVSSGVNVTFDIDLGQGRVHWGNISDRDEELRLNHTFNSTGLKTVTVGAWNYVSNKTRTVTISIEKRVTNLTLENINVVVVNSLVTFVAKVNGSINYGNDLLYHWLVNGEASTSSLPAFQTVFSTSGSAIVSVVVSNGASNASVAKNISVIKVIPENHITTSLVVRLGFPSTFSLNKSSQGVIYVNYGDGSTIESVHTPTWQYVYQATGLYHGEVTVNVPGTGNVTQTTLISVQEAIQNLTISGPSAVALYSLALNYMWKAVSSKGSDIVYRWSFDSKEDYLSGSKKVYHRTTESGHYPVKLFAYNDINNASIEMRVTALHPIGTIKLIAPYTVHGHNTTLTLIVFGDKNFTVHVQFGDGMASTYQDNMLNVTTIQASVDHTIVPVYRFDLDYMYEKIGDYEVKVNVSNLVSWTVERKMTKVDEPITGVNVSVQTTRPLLVGQPVVVKATIKTGNDVAFLWDFGDSRQTEENSTANTSVARHIFSENGLFTVTLKLTSPVYATPLIFILPEQLYIEEPISGVEVKLKNDEASNYGVPLLETNGVYKTFSVAFEASAKKGSSVTFTFNFGDGSPAETVAAQQSDGSGYASLKSHSYSQEGVYSVFVTANNNLGNVTAHMERRLHVLIPPQGLKLDLLGDVKRIPPSFLFPQKREYHVLKDGKIFFNASIASGTNVTYNWDFGDGRVLVNKEPHATHTYTFLLFLKSYAAAVTAKNKAGQLKVEFNILPLIKITGTTLTIQGGKYHKINSDVKFQLSSTPQSSATYYTLNFIPENGAKSVYFPNIPLGNGNPTIFTGSFDTANRYTGTLTASHELNSVASSPVELNIVVPVIGPLDIRVKQHGMVNQTMILEVFLLAGSQMSLDWNFADGTNSTVYRTRSIQHVFKRIGIYNVTVKAYNPVSDGLTAWRTVFILDKFCRAPVITLHNSIKDNFTRADQIRLSTDVTVNCSTDKVIYTWNVYNRTTGTSIHIASDSGAVFNRKNLYIPAFILEYGIFIVELKVQMQGTIVYAVKETELTVTPSNITANIFGGLKKVIGRDGLLLLNGTLSHDPDYPESQNLSYTWSCSLLANAAIECFKNNFTLSVYNSSTVTINPAVFNAVKEFNIVLSVSHLGRSATTSQVILVENRESRSFDLSCKECKDHEAIKDRRLTFVTSCPKCSANTTYSWRLKKVIDTKSNYAADAHNLYTCVKADGSTYLSLVINATEINNTAPTSGKPSTTTLATTTTEPSLFPPFGGNNGNPPFGGISEGKRRRRSSSSLLQRLRRQIPGGLPGGFPGNFPIPGEGTGSGTNGGNNNQITTPPPPSTEAPCVGADCVLIHKNVTTINPHLVSQTTEELKIQSLLGTTSQVLVIKPNVLEQGQQYFVEAHVQDGQAVGESWVYFEVNESPVQGTCQILPTKGIAMETIFKIHCYGWKDKNTPLEYEVSYAQNENSIKSIAYRDIGEAIPFYLPAGNVVLHIYIYDKLGSRTEVCTLPVEVFWKNITDTSSYERQINDGLKILTRFMVQDYVDQSKAYIEVIANYLNRRPADDGSKLAANNTSVRERLLGITSAFPLRKESQILQSSTALAQLTAIPGELSKKALKTATELLHRITTTVAKRTDRPQEFVDAVSNVTTDVISFLLSATSLLSDNLSSNFTKDIILNITGITETFLRTKLEGQILGERPVVLGNDGIALFTAQFTKLENQQTTFYDNGASFSVPNSVLTDVVSQDKCFEVQMVTFKNNPYLYGTIQNETVQSNIPSLSLYRCQGSKIDVSDLTPNNEIQIRFSHHDVERDWSNYTLQRAIMNLHQFNVTARNVGKSLHLSIELKPVDLGIRTFPISLMISHKNNPTPQSYDHKKSFDRTTNTLHWHIPSNTLQEIGVYYLAIVDSNFNAGRRRTGEATVRHYSLKFWWNQCLYWNEEIDQWSSDGCSTSERSTAEITYCSCNHLTSFGAHFSLVPNELSLVDLDSLFNIEENYIVIAFVGYVVFIYLLLLIVCCLVDRHDYKPCLVHLEDNKLTDAQTYELTIETGFRKGAGTTAKVCVVLHGTEGISETRELVAKDGKSVFQRNSRNTFVMTLPHSIGRLWKVQLWHNNAGSSPSWYLSRVAIKDLNLGTNYYFLCEKWFAVEVADGKVERELPVLEKHLGFKSIMWIKGTQNSSDFHLWGSVITRPTHTRFTRAERLTCSFSLLMSYLLLNALWYQDTGKEVRGEFGLLDLSWRPLVVGAICCLIILPVNFFLVFLFRRSKIRIPSEGPEKKYKSVLKDGNGGHDTSVDEHSPELQPVMTQSLLDQSMLTWQSLQAWAQKQWEKKYQKSMSSSENVKPEDKKSYETASSGFEDCLSQYQATTIVSSDGAGDTGSQHSAYSSDEPVPIHKYIEPRRKHILLPFWFRYVAWILTLVILFGCSALTVLYGFSFGREKSIKWLQSIYFSFVTCVFIVHPVLILLTTLYAAFYYHNDNSILDRHVDGYSAEEEKCQENARKETITCYSEADALAEGIAARKRSRYLRFARPPREKELIKARKKFMKERKLWSFIWDGICFIVMFVLLFFMAYGKDTKSPFYLNEAIKNTFTQSENQPFTSIKTITGWYNWSQLVLPDRLVFDQWYNGRAVIKSKDLLLDVNSVIIGQVSLRQLRVSSINCPAHEYFNQIMETCRPDYSQSVKSTKSYGDRNASWDYDDFISAKRSNFYGRHAKYDGSGFVVLLNKTRSEIRQQLEELQELHWIDLYTRSVIVEFTMYNAPTQLFSSVSLVAEIPSTGSVFPYSRVNSVFLYKYISTLDNVVLACEILFVVFVFLKMKKELTRMFICGRKYFLRPWSYVEIAFCLLALTYMVCNAYRYVLVQEIVECLRATYHESFVDISILAIWDEALKTMVGLLLFSIVLKILKLLRYIKLFAKFGNIYKKARWEAFVLLLMFVIWLLAYSSMGVALWQSSSFNFSSFSHALVSVSSLFTRGYSFMDVEDVDRIGGALFVISFLVFAVGMTTCYVVAFLTYHHHTYRQEKMVSMSIREVWTYFVSCLGGKQRKKKQKGTGDRHDNGDSDDEDDGNELPPEFTIAEMENQVDELIFKINTMAGALGVESKLDSDEYTDMEYTYKGDDGISSASSEPFDGERFEDRIHKIEDSLYHNDPHLAQLIYLNNVGAISSISDKQEEQLRNQLERELFRHLQLQRQDTSGHSEGYSSGSYGTNHDNDIGSGDLSPEHQSPSQIRRDSEESKSSIETIRKNNQRNHLEDMVLQTLKGQHGNRHVSHANLHNNHGNVKNLHNVQHEPIPEDNENDTVETSFIETDHKKSIKGKNIAQKLRSSPTLDTQGSSSAKQNEYFLHKTHSSKDVVKAAPKAADNAKRKQRPFSSVGEKSSSLHTNSVYDQGPSSESELGSSGNRSGIKKKASEKTSAAPRKNLRKTKSRGKGKGRSHGLIGGIDEFGLDNDAYHNSDSDSDAEINMAASKECWL